MHVVEAILKRENWSGQYAQSCSSLQAELFRQEMVLGIVLILCFSSLNLVNRTAAHVTCLNSSVTYHCHITTLCNGLAKFAYTFSHIPLPSSRSRDAQLHMVASGLQIITVRTPMFIPGYSSHQHVELQIQKLFPWGKQMK